MPSHRAPGRLLLAALLAPAGAALGADWTVDAGTEPARVSIGNRETTWWTHRVQLSSASAPGQGMYVAVENQRRDDASDTALQGGLYGRNGAWRWSGQISLANDPAFMPRYSIEPTLGGQFGDYEVQAGASYRSFVGLRTRIATLALIRYSGNDEYALKVAAGSTEPGDRRIRVVTARALIDRGGPVVAGFSASVGQGLYDAANVPGIKGNHGWAVNANLRYKFNAHDSVRLDLGAGREDPAFRERKIGLSYRRTF